MESKLIRQKFIDFFVSKGHTHVASSSLIPAQDPTLLFTNAGMNQFKDVFLGHEKRPYTRAVTSQKCMRAGGKHNDLENVGFTKRHLTFFEMLGNFSFGDYFKKEAIAFAWEFITVHMALPKEHLYVSIYQDDDESFAIWHEGMGVPADRIYRLGEKENFWSMGDLGPCGPCTEIHVDRGPLWGCSSIEHCGPACDCDRFLEIWNLVFMQYDRQKDGTLKPLAKTGVDTGMGLERMCAFMQQKDSVLDTDLFAPIRRMTETISGKRYDDQPENLKAAFRVLEDHVRASSMLIADGCMPSNEGRGYVLRKIIRRAALFARKLTEKSLLPELSHVVVADFGSVYPELVAHEELIATTLAQEVDKFSDNLVRGQSLLEKFLEANQATKILPGDQAFKLYDTYGFPIELVTLMAKERGFTVDIINFQEEMTKQQERSGKQTQDVLDYVQLPNTIVSTFVGYDMLQTNSPIVAIIDENGNSINSLPAESFAWIIPAQSPLFALGGGQVADKGLVTHDGHTRAIQDIRLISGHCALRVQAQNTMAVGDVVTVAVDCQHRQSVARNHTASHLLQAALIAVVDPSIKQSGSYVCSDYLRFDFTTAKTISHEQLNEVERLVNKHIRENQKVVTEHTSFAQAKERGVLAFFEEKYAPELVRVVSVPGFSAELCCGTHVHATGDIGACKIIELKAVSAGNRRIVAVTGSQAIDLFQQLFDQAKDLSSQCNVAPHEVAAAITGYQKIIKEQALALKKLKKEARRASIAHWSALGQLIDGMHFLYLDVPEAENDELKEVAQELLSKKPGFYFLSSSVGDRSTFVAMLSKEHIDRLNLRNVASWLKEKHGVNGGGSSVLIQGGGAKLDANFAQELQAFLADLR